MVKGQNTAVRDYVHQIENFPTHWNQTRCVFVNDEHLCSLQVASSKESDHPWDFKLRSCWLFSLTEHNDEIQPPIHPSQKDPFDIGDDYKGYATYTWCGKHSESGDYWQTTLNEELIFHQQQKK